MKRISIALLATLLVVGCDDKSKGDGKPEPQAGNGKTPETTKHTPQVDPKPQPEVDPTPPPEPEPLPNPIRIAIASVTMVEDCPDPPAPPPPPPPAEPAAAERAPADEEMAAAKPVELGDVAPGAAAHGGDMPDFCEQSMMQLTVSGHEGDPAPVKIVAVRLLRPSDKTVVAELKARGPMVWDDKGAYAPWDESLEGGTEVKASYKLSVPSWSDVETKLGHVPSEGHMFVLEVDVSVGGVQQTVTSPEFARREPEVVVT